jgi:hypothetical protein
VTSAPNTDRICRDGGEAVGGKSGECAKEHRPRTEEGKRRSRRNAMRHGLTAETVIDGLEDTEDYRAFEATIIADYDAHTAVERELVLRLASLLWRIRRATGIETNLLRIQAEIIRERENPSASAPATSRNCAPAFQTPPRLRYRFFRPGVGAPPPHEDMDPDASQSARQTQDDVEEEIASDSRDPSRQLTHCFLRLVNLDNGVFDRLARYEATLWRQVVQTMFVLKPLRRQRYRFG